MAKFQQGINGPFSGKIGNVIGSNWRGIPYMKSVSKKSTKQRSPKQLKNEQEFAIACRWLSPLVDYVREGFDDPSNPKRGYIAAKSYLLDNALVRKGSDSYIIASKMLISKGSLPQAADLEMSFDTEACEINIRWNPVMTEDPADQRRTSFNDQAMYLAYDFENGDVYGQVYSVLRSTGHCQIALPKNKVARYHVYIAFHAANRKDRSDSRYLGVVEVSG